MKKLMLLISILALIPGFFAAGTVIVGETGAGVYPIDSPLSFEGNAALYTAAEIDPQNTKMSAILKDSNQNRLDTAPNPAVLISPGANATGIPRNAILSWTLAGGNPTGVRVYLDTMNPPLASTEVGLVTSWDPPGLLAPNQDYWWKVVPWNATGPATPTVQYFKTGTGVQYPASGATSASDTDIGQITLAGFANPAAPGPSTNNPSATGTYTDYKALGPIPLFQGYFYPFNMSQISSGNNLYAAYGKVYIDYNQDGAFDLVNELAFNGLVSTSLATPTLSGTITIPADASLGQTRMRVVLREGGTAANTLPTGTYIQGETEDYTVEILEPNVSDPVDPILIYPESGQTGLPKSGFSLTWIPDLSYGAGLPELYTVYLFTESDLINPAGYWETTETCLNPLTSTEGPDPALEEFQYNERWYWAVGAVIAGYREIVSEQQWFKIEEDPMPSIPHTQNFGNDTPPVWPAHWTQTCSGDLISDCWAASASIEAGGTANEMKLSWQNAVGISRLISPPLNSGGLAGFNVQFKHYFNDYAAGANAKVQYSHDLSTWYDTDWSLASGAGDASGTETAHIMDINQPITYVAWVIDGNHYQLDYWYVDDVNIVNLPSHDIALGTPIGLPESQAFGTTYHPQITIQNKGSSTDAFSVTLSFPGYSSTQTVTGLTSGDTATVSFTFWTPEELQTQNWVVIAPLTDDANPENNTRSGSFTVFAAIWSNEAACPIGSYLGSAASYVDANCHGHIVSSGGNTSTGLNNEVQDYNVNTNTWTTLTTLPADRVAHASAIVSSKLYIIGGVDANSVYQSTVDAYDLNTGTWTSRNPLPVALGWIKAVGYQNNYIYVAGGVDGTSQAVLNTVYIYSISSNTWTAASPMPGELFGGAFGISGSNLVYAGGADEDALSSIVYLGRIDLSNPSLVAWASSRTSYPGLSKPANVSSADLKALVATAPIGKDDSISRFPYPAGAMYRFDAATWNDNSIIVAGGSPTSAWLPGNPGKAYTYDTSTDTWYEQPNMYEPVLGAYMSTVKSDSNTWNCIVASGLNLAGLESSTTQKIMQVSGVFLASPELSICKVDGGLELQWCAVVGANSYKIYGCNDCTTNPATWTELITCTDCLIYLYTGDEDYIFFTVCASTDMP